MEKFSEDFLIVSITDDEKKNATIISAMLKRQLMINFDIAIHFAHFEERINVEKEAPSSGILKKLIDI